MERIQQRALASDPANSVSVWFPFTSAETHNKSEDFIRVHKGSWQTLLTLLFFWQCTRKLFCTYFLTWDSWSLLQWSHWQLTIAHTCHPHLLMHCHPRDHLQISRAYKDTENDCSIWQGRKRFVIRLEHKITGQKPTFISILCIYWQVTSLNTFPDNGWQLSPACWS